MVVVMVIEECVIFVKLAEVFGRESFVGFPVAYHFLIETDYAVSVGINYMEIVRDDYDPHAHLFF